MFNKHYINIVEKMLGIAPQKSRKLWVHQNSMKKLFVKLLKTTEITLASLR